MATGFFDLGFGGFGEFRRGHFERAGDFTVAEDFEEFLVVTHKAGVGQHRDVDFGDLGIEPGEIADVDDDRFHAESRLVKTAVREFTVKGHLAAFEAGTDAAAGTGRLALAAATGGLTVAAAFAATDALLAVNSTDNVLEFVEFHRSSCLGGARSARGRDRTRMGNV